MQASSADNCLLRIPIACSTNSFSVSAGVGDYIDLHVIDVTTYHPASSD